MSLMAAVDEVRYFQSENDWYAVSEEILKKACIENSKAALSALMIQQHFPQGKNRKEKKNQK